MPATMDWTYPATGDEAGIFEIGRRLAETLGRAPDVSRFSYDPREMLRTTRQVETASRGGRLLSGFQTAAKLTVEIPRYADLLAAGTRVTVYAIGPKPADPALEGLDYRELAPDSRALANQWVLVTDDPEPLAFLSYELGDPAHFGVGGAATPGKRFVGFVSDDPGVVGLLVNALVGVARPAPPPPPAPTRAPSPTAASLIAALDGVQAPNPVVKAGAVVIAIGKGDDRRAFLVGATIARRDGRALVLVDRSAEGFSSPYGDMRGDDSGRPSPERLVDQALARREGRAVLASFLEAASAIGLEAGGWFPLKAGGEGLTEAARRFGGTLFVLPPDGAKPGLAERLRGMSAEKIASLSGHQVLVAG